MAKFSIQLMEHQEEKQMATEIIRKAARAGARVVQVGVEAARFKATAANAVEDGVIAAKRAVKRSRYAAEDLMEETAHQIKRHPFESAGIVFGVGFCLGLLAGVLAGRRKNNSSE